MSLRAHAQHKYLINYVLQGPRPTHEIIYIKHTHLAYVVYQTNYHSNLQWGLIPNIQNKTSKKHHMQMDLSISVRSKIKDITEAIVDSSLENNFASNLC